MEAKEMFEKLGYEFGMVVGRQRIFAYINNGNTVLFYLDNKIYYVYDEFLSDSVKVAKAVYPNLHLAIHQQMKELGWIE